MLHTLNMSERAIYFVQIGQSVAKIWPFFLIFQDGGCPPSWICYSRVWTQHKVDFGGLCHCANWFESVQQFR